MAIVVDGTETSARGQTVAFASGALPRPGGPLMGLAIAIVTAVVTMGALGPRPPEAAVAAACATDHAESVADVPAPAATLAPTTITPTPDAATSSAVPWWRLPQMAEWIDPAAAWGMQRSMERARQVGHDHRVAR